MNIVIMHQTITMHDAIGNDIEQMFEILNERHRCKCFAQNRFNKNVEYIDKEGLDEILADPTAVVIYHHSVFWEDGERYLEKSKAKLVFRYHNITPPEFFEEYNDFHFIQCKSGREQTQYFAKEYPEAFWLFDSQYNSEDVPNVKRKAICPPFHKIDKWGGGKPDESVLKKLVMAAEINLLFVGRIVPNKGYLFLIDVLACYCLNYDRNIKLRLVGKFDDGLEGYNKKLMSKVTEYGLDDCVEFIGEITDATLLAYYLGSDIFICASEHEGFCVPVTEAQYFKLPVIAHRSSAVSETIGVNQLVFGEDIRDYAAAIHLIMEKREYRKYLTEQATRNFESRFSCERIKSTFLEAFESLTTES